MQSSLTEHKVAPAILAEKDIAQEGTREPAPS